MSENLYTAPLDTYFRHKDGGVYVTTGRAKLTTTGEWVMLYKHIWPFPQQDWVRPASEWTSDRFSRLTRQEVIEIFQEDREEAQARVTAAKEARKAQEAIQRDFTDV